MGCGSCSTGSCSSTPNGCNSNGGCGSGGCNKLNTYDWFGSMQNPNQSESENVYEIRFKNTRKAFFKNVNGISLITGDFVAVESDRGFDVGQISLGGVLAQLQMKKRKPARGEKIRKIYRRATAEDMEKLRLARSREHETLIRTREIIRELNLEMKASEVEFQGDNAKAIFYYIADQRVDFRELIKILATEFKIRVEMKQIGLRHESGLVGGIGSCGRELCCSTWLTDFKSVSTSAARYQNLSLNPMKISGQCGRLKCCLNFELDAYLDALKDIPDVDRIDTEQGIAFLQKTDIFKGVMWFSYKNESTWIPLEVEKVVVMAEMNAKGEKPASLRILDIISEEEAIDFVDVVGQSTLKVEPRRKKGKGRGRGKNPNNRSGSGDSRRGKEGGGNPRSKNRNQKPRNKRGNSGDGENKDKNTDANSGESGTSEQKPRNSRGGNNRNRNKRGGRGGNNNRRGGKGRNNNDGNSGGGGNTPPPQSDN